MRIFIVGHEPLFREGLKRIISGSRDLAVVGEAASSRDWRLTNENLELLILDDEIDSIDILQSINKIRLRGRPPFILVVAAEARVQRAVQVLATGADGYLDKTNSSEVILGAIQRTGRGGKYVGMELAEGLLMSLDQQDPSGRLSYREYQVLSLLGEGKAVKEIASRLSLSIKTVSTYRGRVLGKLHLKSSNDLLRYAFKEGIVG